MNRFEEEWAKMLNGEIYDAVHPEFLRRLEVTRQKLWEFNRMNPSDTNKLKAIFRSIVEDSEIKAIQGFNVLVKKSLTRSAASSVSVV